MYRLQTLSSYPDAADSRVLISESASAAVLSRNNNKCVFLSSPMILLPVSCVNSIGFDAACFDE